MGAPRTTSNSIAVTLVAPPTPTLELSGSLLFSETGVELTVGAPPGTVAYFAGSLELLPTVIPGLLTADIGNQFASPALLQTVPVKALPG